MQLDDAFTAAEVDEPSQQTGSSTQNVTVVTAVTKKIKKQTPRKIPPINFPNQTVSAVAADPKLFTEKRRAPLRINYVGNITEKASSKQFALLRRR